MIQNDADLEWEIERYTVMLITATTPSERHTAWEWLRQAIDRRSEMMVHDMQAKQGLSDT